MTEDLEEIGHDYHKKINHPAFLFHFYLMKTTKNLNSLACRCFSCY